jgi:hypothetical protein
MRTAPPVSVSCTGGLIWRWVQSVVPALAAAALAAWAAGHQAWPADNAAWVALLCAAIVGALAWWRAAPHSLVLHWDGQQWAADGIAMNAHVMMGLPRWLLLRLRAVDGHSSRWCAVSATDAGPMWHGLRVALFANQPRSGTGLLTDIGPHV